MKKTWLWSFLLGFVALMLLFVVSVFIATTLFGDRKQFVVGEGIGLVEIKGIILDSQETTKQLIDFKKNEDVKAVVLRIDSPGGVVGPSQEIYSEVKKLAAKKKVVVSMGSVAASGGYYIAVPATRIIANPGTITGSIGVLMKFSNIEGLMDKIGMKSFTLKTGKFKDVGSPLRTMSAQDKSMLQSVIDSTHGQFVNAVAEGRRLPLNDVQNIADGRIFTGEQALRLKLVDGLGTLQDAIEEAGKLAGIKGEPRVIKPAKKKKVFMDLLVEESAEKLGSLVKHGIDGISVNYEFNALGM